MMANPGSPTEPHPRLRNGHPDVQGVQLQRPNMSFACTHCFGPHNIDKRIMVKKAVKRCCSNNLKNDYESEEINSQDSEHEDKKSNNPYSECDDKEETYAYYNVLQRNTVKQNVPPCSTVHQLCSPPRMQQLPPSLPRM